jgi:type I restriction enzyme S subunit
MWCYFFLFQLDLGKLVNPGAVPSVNESQMSNIPVCVPPTQEQKQIGDYLVTETTKINKMIDKVNASIIQLSEYRASLIHHAVTGKIDLRGHDAHAQ